MVPAALAALALASAAPALRVVAIGRTWGLPADAIPMDWAAGRTLFSSDSTGIWEVAQGGKGTRIWANQGGGKPGEARYGSARIYAGIYGKGLVELRAGSLSFVEGVRSDLLQILVTQADEVWAASVPLPSGHGGGVQIVRAGKVAGSIALAGRELATLRAWIEVPERGSVFAAALGGVLELRRGAPAAVLLQGPVAAIARQPKGRVIGVAGSVVARWDGAQFVPVLFRPGVAAGSPIDLAIGESGAWYVLYPGGVVAVLAPGGELARTLAAADGVPATARRLLLAGMRLLIGSDEGVFSLEE